MKKHVFILFLLVSGTIFAQNKISYGEYWFNADIQTTKSITLNPIQDLHLLTNVPVNHLNDGLHTIHFRFKDDNNNWTGTISNFFVKQTLQGTSSGVLVSEYDYWFDNQLATKIRLNIDDLSAFHLKNELDVSTLSDGLHTVHFRFFDTKGHWSSAVSKFFVKSSTNNVSLVKEIISYEYWFDNDLLTKGFKSIENTKNFSLIEPLDVSYLGTGLHTVHYRFKDSQNTWSSVISKFFVIKKENGITSASEILRVDHWVDNKIDDMVSTLLSKSSELTLKINMDASNLTDGLHTLHYRFMDNHGLFSSAISRFFVKRPVNQPVTNNKIVACRYWLNDSVMHYVNLEDSAQQVIFMDSLDLRGYRKGEYIVYVQFKDEQGLWSSAVGDTIQKLAFLYAELIANMQKTCLGDSVQLTALVADADLLEWDLGDGTKDTNAILVHTYEMDGSFPVSILLTDTVDNKTKTFHLETDIVVHPEASVDLGDSLLLLKNESTELDAGNNFSEYYWNGILGEGIYKVDAEELGLGRHEIKLSVKDLNGCMAGDTIIINVSSGLGFEENRSLKIKVFPNPSSQYISVIWDDNQCHSIPIRLIDMTGRVVLQKANLGAAEKIDIRHVPSGQYLLQISMGEQIITVPIGKI